MEDTHLKDLKRLRKLFALICLAYLLGVIIGKYKDTHQKKIRIKKHGYKAHSYFAYGFHAIGTALDRGGEWIAYVIDVCIDIGQNGIEAVKLKPKLI